MSVNLKPPIQQGNADFMQRRAALLQFFQTWLSLALLPVAYFSAVALNQYHVLSGGNWNSMVRILPPFDQFYTYALQNSGEKSAERFTAISACLFLIVFCYFLVYSAFAISRVVNDRANGIPVGRHLSFFDLLKILLGISCFGIFFFIRIPEDDGPHGVAMLILSTDLKFILYYGLAMLVVWGLVRLLAVATRILIGA